MVEDNEDDARLVDMQLQRSDLKHALHVVSTGRECMRYLKGEGRYADRLAFPFPCLLIIDLKVPEMDGFALIEWTKGNEVTRDIPIIIYSGSASREDAERAYSLGVNGYFAKLPGPGNLNLLFAAIREFCGEN